MLWMAYKSYQTNHGANGPQLDVFLELASAARETDCSGYAAYPEGNVSIKRSLISLGLRHRVGGGNDLVVLSGSECNGHRISIV